MIQFVGRKREIIELSRLKESKTAEFVALYGRRRVGKTYLVRTFFQDHFTFYATGLARGNRKEQLLNFHKSLCSYANDESYADPPEDWYAAFDYLKRIISASRQRRKVVFLDELPWMDTQKSEFLKALESFWNSWGSMQPKLLLIVCGSAASWMVQNIIRNRGGLHNRLTCHLHLSPFNLAETQQYLHSQGIKWNKELVAECYMILGGIPYYLHLLDKSLSLAQNIDRLFFAQNALLHDEYDNLFSSLFKNSGYYEAIIAALSKKRCGLTRKEISTDSKQTNGGGLTRRLKDLIQCGFVKQYKPINKPTEIYQLSDFFCLFYFRFLNHDEQYDRDAWLHLQASSAYANWLGLTFESLCFAHVYQIQKALGITGIATKTYALHTNTSQIDMVIQRADKVTSLCEMKFTKAPYILTKSEAEKIQRRSDELAMIMRSQKQVLITLVLNRPPKQNEQYNSIITSKLDLEDLFSE